MMKHMIAAVSLLVLAACGTPAPQNAITENIAANVAEPDITDVPDESADANASDSVDDNASLPTTGNHTAAKPAAKGLPVPAK